MYIILYTHCYVVYNGVAYIKYNKGNQECNYNEQSIDFNNLKYNL